MKERDLGSIPKITSIDFPTWDEVKSGFDRWWGGEDGGGGVKKGIEEAASWTLWLFNEPTATKEEAGAAIADWWNTKGRPGVQEFCTWALNAPESPYSTEGDAEKIIKPWWSTVGGWIDALPAASASTLSGARVEMDGATVGKLVLPYVSAGLSRANRVAYKAVSAG